MMILFVAVKMNESFRMGGTVISDAVDNFEEILGAELQTGEITQNNVIFILF